MLEEYVLKPFIKSQGPGRKPYLCKEGELGRFDSPSAFPSLKHTHKHRGMQTIAIDRNPGPSMPP